MTDPSSAADVTIADLRLPVPRWYGRAVWAVSLAGMALICLLAIGGGTYLYDLWPLAGAAPAAVILLAGRRGHSTFSAPAEEKRGQASPREASPYFPRRQWPALVFLAAFVIRGACVWLVPYLPCRDFLMYHESGVWMADHWALGDPARTPTYRCFIPPGQPFSLGVLYGLFGRDVHAAQMLNVLYGSLTVLGVYFLARRLFGERCARAASLLAAVFPSQVFGCMLTGAEVPETFWLIAALCFYVGWLDRRGKLWAALACGLCLGVGSMIRPTFLLLPIPLGLHMLLAWRKWGLAPFPPFGKGACPHFLRPHFRAIPAAASMAAGVLAVVLPWTLRNYHVTGGFLLISSNGGGNLYSANNDKAEGAYTEEAWVRLYQTCPDDLTLQKTGTRLAVDWIRSHPRRFAELAAIKFVRLWITDREAAWWALELPHMDQSDLGVAPFWRMLAMAGSEGFYMACLLACVLALWKHRRALAANRAWMFVPVLLAYFTAIHMVFESQGKYHFMLMPLLCVLAPLAAGRIARGDSNPRPDSRQASPGGV